MSTATTLQNMRISNNLSQSQLSKLSGVNLRTLQDFEQGRKPLKNAKGEMLYRLSLVLNCSIADLLSDTVIDIEPYSSKNASHIKTYCEKITSIPLYDKYYTFPVIVPHSKINMERVYPTKQSLIYKLNKALSTDEHIASIMLFGSSITMRCRMNSDTDLAIRLNDKFVDNDTKNNVSETIQEICDWKADIIWFDRINKTDKIYHDICKGVQIV